MPLCSENLPTHPRSISSSKQSDSPPHLQPAPSSLFPAASIPPGNTHMCSLLIVILRMSCLCPHLVDNDTKRSPNTLHKCMSTFQEQDLTGVPAVSCYPALSTTLSLLCQASYSFPFCLERTLSPISSLWLDLSGYHAFKAIILGHLTDVSKSLPVTLLPAWWLLAPVT